MSHQPQIFAHRGAKQVAPENTLPAFQKALEMGVDGIELDVQCTRDHRLVVIHDFDVTHTTNGIGKVADFLYRDLARLDAGSHFSQEFAGTPIPTLDQVFDLVEERCLVNVEIKTKAWHGGRAVGPLVAMLQRRNLHDQVIVSSFNPAALLAIRWRDPKVPLGLLCSPRTSDFLSAVSSRLIAPEALHPHHSMVDAEYIRQAHSRGYFVNTWTVNDITEARRLAALGVDVIMTDVPDQIIDGLEQVTDGSHQSA